MNLTPGEMLFYGGIAGMAIVLITAIIVIAVLSGSRKRLRRKLNEEYGNNKSEGEKPCKN
jgi:Na+-transporting methylmalonyl-CoA/oxaloacetate decarboxylase gamma subunit